MHVVVAWEIKIPLGTERSQLAKSLRECLEGFSWVRPLSGLYIVQVDDDVERDLIKSNLMEVSKANPGKLRLIISPVMDGGRYSGWIPKDLWPKIRKRTD